MTDRRTQSWPNLDRTWWQVENMRDVLAKVSRPTLQDLLRRAGESARPLEEGAGAAVSDGYPTNSGGQSDIHSGRMADPSAQAALRDYVVDRDSGKFIEWRTPFDPVGHSLREFFALLSEANGVLRELDKKLTYLRADRDAADKGGPAPPPPGAGMCEACGRVVTGAVGDKLISGYCKAHRKAWERANYPDRVQFAKQIQAQMKAPREEAG